MDRLTDCLATLHGVPSTPELAQRVGAELSQLPDLDQTVLRARFGLAGRRPMLLNEFAAGYPELTTNRVRLVESRGLEALEERVFA
jgi:DNA-directed RNA polymerase sigma subunit (sigma70/sigma32)